MNGDPQQCITEIEIFNQNGLCGKIKLSSITFNDVVLFPEIEIFNDLSITFNCYIKTGK